MSESIGTQLRKAREDRGVSIGEAAQATRIRPGYLQALEDDNFAGLPSPVQGRGFLRNYAAYLGLLAEPLLEAWPGRPPPVALPVGTSQAAASQDRKSRPVHALPPSDDGPSGRPEKRDPHPAGEALLGTESSPRADTDWIPPEPELVEGEPPQGTPGFAGLAVSRGTGAVQAGQQPVQEAEPASRSQEILTEIGATLHTQRELLSLSLTDIERYTHLRLHYLNALEGGRLEDLPSPTQGRGMLNNYARFLNLDADRLLNQFADALIARREERVRPGMPGPQSGGHRPAPKPPSRPALFRFLSLDLLVGGGLILALIAVVVWTASQVMAVRSEPEGEPTAPSISAMLLASPEVIASPGMPAVEPQTSAQPAAGTSAVGTPDEAAATPTPGSSLESSTLLPLQEGTFQVSVVALQRVWMKVLVDGQVEFMGRTKPGSVYTYPADERVELLTGNAAGIQVVFNQEPLGQLGNWSEVVHRVFTRDGAFAPTATATPTPTRTPRVTITPTPTETLNPSMTPRSTIPAP